MPRIGRIRIIQSKYSNGFFDTVRNNAPGENGKYRKPLWESMDYKQLGAIGQYADFGNFNYGVVGRAIGLPRELLLYAAGVAQQRNKEQKDEHGKVILDKSGNGKIVDWHQALAYALADPINKGDNEGDQKWILEGMDAADKAGISRPLSRFGTPLDIDDRIWLALIPLLGAHWNSIVKYYVQASNWPKNG